MTAGYVVFTVVQLSMSDFHVRTKLHPNYHTYAKCTLILYMRFMFCHFGSNDDISCDIWSDYSTQMTVGIYFPL